MSDPTETINLEGKDKEIEVSQDVEGNVKNIESAELKEGAIEFTLNSSVELIESDTGGGQGGSGDETKEKQQEVDGENDEKQDKIKEGEVTTTCDITEDGEKDAESKTTTNADQQEIQLKDDECAVTETVNMDDTEEKNSCVVATETENSTPNATDGGGDNDEKNIKPNSLSTEINNQETLRLNENRGENNDETLIIETMVDKKCDDDRGHAVVQGGLDENTNKDSDLMKIDQTNKQDSRVSGELVVENVDDDEPVNDLSDIVLLDENGVINQSTEIDDDDEEESFTLRVAEEEAVAEEEEEDEDDEEIEDENNEQTAAMLNISVESDCIEMGEVRPVIYADEDEQMIDDDDIEDDDEDEDDDDDDVEEDEEDDDDDDEEVEDDDDDDAVEIISDSDDEPTPAPAQTARPYVPSAPQRTNIPSAPHSSGLSSLPSQSKQIRIDDDDDHHHFRFRNIRNSSRITKHRKRSSNYWETYFKRRSIKW